MPGDILQLVNARLSYKDATSSKAWETNTQHSAVIESANGKVLQVLEQNIPVGAGVARHEFNLGWTLERGHYRIYRP